MSERCRYRISSKFSGLTRVVKEKRCATKNRSESLKTPGWLIPAVTGKFQLTAWLYQFVSEGSDELYYESRTGLGIMDIMLVYKNSKYIVETKINRYPGTADEALEQLTEKYLMPEKVDHGYIVLFDPKTKVGELCTPQKKVVEGKEVLIFNIAIGR